MEPNALVVAAAIAAAVAAVGAPINDVTAGNGVTGSSAVVVVVGRPVRVFVVVASARVVVILSVGVLGVEVVVCTVRLAAVVVARVVVGVGHGDRIRWEHWRVRKKKSKKLALEFMMKKGRGSDWF